MTPFDKQLLNILQTGLPISKRPFADLAKLMDAEEAFVIDRLRQLKEDGYLRRIGPFFDSEKLGYRGTLVAVKVKAGCTASVAAAINGYPGVTHNYEREGEYNLWFTLLAPDAARQQTALAQIRSLPGVEDLMSLVSNKKYKINVQFELK